MRSSLYDLRELSPQNQKGEAKMIASLSNINQRIAHLEALKNIEIKADIKHEEGIIKYENSDNLIYIPSTTGIGFGDCNDFVALVMGPYGSGKSTMCVNKIIRSSTRMPKWRDGRRRSRWACVRNTSGELQSTTLQTWLAWAGDVGDVHRRQKPILTYTHLFNDGLGVIELELLFIALDRPEDVRKVKSLELTGCYINELSEVPQAALAHMKGRVGRFPRIQDCAEPFWAGIICDTNPPDEDHWIYNDFEVNKIEGYRLFKQPPGLIKTDDGKWVRNPEADNIKHLPVDYYEKLATGQSEEFVKVFCLGQYGTVGTGKLVYPDYNDDIHSVDDIPATQGDPIHLAWDFGLTPHCLVYQIGQNGQFRALKEYGADNMSINTFAESVVLPSLKSDFPYNKIGFSDADPAGNNRNDVMDEMSSIGMLNEIGILTEAASTNKIEPRLNAVRFFLSRMISGKPGFVISKKGCPTLRKGFLKNYVYKRLAVAGEERYKNEPDKGSASHIHDCLQYGALRFASNTVTQERKLPSYESVWNPGMRLS